MIYTVFPEDMDELPQDFSTFEDAQFYAENLGCNYEIVGTEGDCEL